MKSNDGRTESKCKPTSIWRKKIPGDFLDIKIPGLEFLNKKIPGFEFLDKKFPPALVVLVIVALLGYLIFGVFDNVREVSIRAKCSRAKVDMRALGMAIEQYMLANKTYPPMKPFRSSFLDPAGDSILKNAGGLDVCGVEPGTGKDHPGLTTPLAYLADLPPDPFSPRKGNSFGYYRDTKGCILFSCGPDYVYDIDPKVSYSGAMDENTTLLSLILKTYDATNGTYSGGDIWRIRQ